MRRAGLGVQHDPTYTTPIAGDDTRWTSPCARDDRLLVCRNCRCRNDGRTLMEQNLADTLKDIRLRLEQIRGRL